MKQLLMFLLVLFLFFTEAKENSIKDVDAVSIQSDVTVGTKAPDGWVRDNTLFSRYGVCAFYYIKGKDFNSSPVVIYPKIIFGQAGEKAINSIVSNMVKTFKSSKAFRLKNEKPYQSKNGFNFVVKHFLNGPPPNQFEAVGYLSFKNSIFLLVYSARTEVDFNKYMSKFTEALDRVSPYSSNMSDISGLCLYPK